MALHPTRISKPAQYRRHHRFVPARLADVVFVAGLLGALLVACTADEASVVPVPSEIVADGFKVEVVVEGLDSPTQIATLPDGRLLVAQLNGGEGEANGQVLEVDLATGRQTVLFDGLDKPTGVALFSNQIWVMERQSLARGGLDGGELVTVVSDLPSNGRSEGTLTPLGLDRLIYITSGDREGGSGAEGSGTIFTIDGDNNTAVLATGFKNAYGHTVADDGTIWVTEVSDGSYDGIQAKDEVLAVVPDQDHGWPWCVGDNRTVTDFGGDERACELVPRPQGVFEPGATPTSVAVAPWDPELLVVALWNRGAIVTVPIDAEVVSSEHEGLISGITHPQHLLADGDRLLVVDFDRGLILSFTPK